ncbi:sensory transduction histidine kinase bacterial, putative [Ricinus communis]|uniref:Sensory transduction histidine kinase bacterial, putative n=1 Tax=Ricinus communis TaxID=3988 RepID=B9S7Q7_RICCO|nr:sensory transduction histidine kinase bacterial, putative [Ricinus communis]|eukprot:XP_002522026.1 two-component response regulator ARR22 [Ricinus communis]
MAMNSESSTANDEKTKGNKIFSALIVDDDRVLRRIHKKILTGQGVVEIQEAGDGQEAVELHRAGASFDLILMDLHMPIMDGCQATKELRDMGINCTILGVSTCYEEEHKKFMESGIDDCISKPLSLNKLASWLPAKDNSEAEDTINSSYNNDTDETDDPNSSSCSSSNINI